MPGFYRFLFGFIPFILAFSAGMILVTPVSAILLAIVWLVAAWFWTSTQNAELGSVIGLIAVIVAVSATVGLAIAYAIVYGSAIDLTWIFREGVI